MDLLLLLFIFLIFSLPMFLMARTNRKRVEKAHQLQASVKPGDRIITVSGFHGEIVGADEATLQLEVALGTVVTMERAGVFKLVDDASAVPADSAAGEDLSRADGVDSHPENDLENPRGN